MDFGGVRRMGTSVAAIQVFAATSMALWNCGRATRAAAAAAASEESATGASDEVVRLAYGIPTQLTPHTHTPHPDIAIFAQFLGVRCEV